MEQRQPARRKIVERRLSRGMERVNCGGTRRSSYIRRINGIEHGGREPVGGQTSNTGPSTLAVKPRTAGTGISALIRYIIQPKIIMFRKHLSKLKRLRQGNGALQGPALDATEILDSDETEALSAEPRVDPITELREGQEVRGRHRYQLRKPLGAGTFGAVWSADCIERDQEAADLPPQLVAIKFFSMAADGEGTAFLRRELAALRSMRSRFIPRIYDWTIDDKLSFFVMDYYPHGTLAGEFSSPGRFDDKKTWRLLIDLLRALQVAHRAGMLHLDIKPSNIMRDGAGGYNLIDFGISQATQITEGPGQTVGAGSQGYQAPEQRRLELHKMDTRTDLWAVGATAWALRTGYDLARYPEKLNLNASADEPSLPPLSTECPDVAPELEDIVASLVREDQKSRPGGAATVLEQIKAATGITEPGEPPGAQPRSYTEEEVDGVVENLMDPLWSSLCHRPDFRPYFTKFEKGDYLCREGRGSHDAFVLLSGEVRIEKAGRTLEIDDREGTFIGEISALTGMSRAASVVADGTVWTCQFNAAEFERLVAAHPSIGIRLLKLLAERVIRSSRANQ